MACVCILVGWVQVLNTLTHMRSCVVLQECTLIYGAEMASVRGLDIEPLTFRPADCKIMLLAITHTHKHSQYLLLFPSPLSSLEFKSKMNLSVTGWLQLQEKHTFQHLGSGRESRGEEERELLGQSEENREQRRSGCAEF